MIQAETSVETPWPAGDWEPLAQRAIAAALATTPYSDIATAPYLAEVSIRFTSDEEVRNLNRDYRQKDKPTNVLSFPMVQPDLLEGLSEGDDGETLLGEGLGRKVRKLPRIGTLPYDRCRRHAASAGSRVPKSNP